VSRGSTNIRSEDMEQRQAVATTAEPVERSVTDLMQQVTAEARDGGNPYATLTRKNVESSSLTREEQARVLASADRLGVELDPGDED